MKFASSTDSNIEWIKIDTIKWQKMVIIKSSLEAKDVWSGLKQRFFEFIGQ